MSDASTGSGEDSSGRRSIWVRPERGTRGPAPTQSREAIATAAIALADAEGLGSVSMRAVATALGTGAGSLYRYLSSRDELLDLMVDATVAELRPYPEATGNWLDTATNPADSGSQPTSPTQPAKPSPEADPQPTSPEPSSSATEPAA